MSGLRELKELNILEASGNFFQSGHCPEPIYCMDTQGLALAKKGLWQQSGLGSASSAIMLQLLKHSTKSDTMN